MKVEIVANKLTDTGTVTVPTFDIEVADPT